MRDYHYGIYVGRFQPLHIGHEHVIREALEKVDTLILVIGSSFIARTPVNPFTFAEREEMIASVFRHEIATGRLVIIGLYDYEEDKDWADALRERAHEAILEHANKGGPGLHGTRDYKIALAGYGKDASSFYLNMFPEWGSIQIQTQHGTINASDIRDIYFRRLPAMPQWGVSSSILGFLQKFAWQQSFKDLLEYREELNYGRQVWGNGPFLAADALVEWRGKILLVTRGKAIGRGCLAMPGGFVEPGERFFDAALRELHEETGIKIAELEDFLDGFWVADKPNRSLRGRIVSMVYRFVIPDAYELDAKAGDDASHAGWYRLDEVSTDRFFEDHHTLIANAYKEVTL